LTKRAWRFGSQWTDSWIFGIIATGKRIFFLSTAMFSATQSIIAYAERDISEPGSDNSAFADWVFRLEYDVLGLPRPTLNPVFRR